MFPVPSDEAVTRAQTFHLKYLNTADPLKQNNNLGCSISKGNSYLGEDVKSQLRNLQFGRWCIQVAMQEHCMPFLPQTFPPQFESRNEWNCVQNNFDVGRNRFPNLKPKNKPLYPNTSKGMVKIPEAKLMEKSNLQLPQRKYESSLRKSSNRYDSSSSSRNQRLDISGGSSQQYNSVRGSGSNVPIPLHRKCVC